MRTSEERASGYASVGVHTEVEITLSMTPQDELGAEIYFGHDGPDLVMDFADADSLEPGGGGRGRGTPTPGQTGPAQGQ